MTPTSVYAVSPRWDPAFVWPLVRATSTPPAPTSKPVGSPPCATPRVVGPLIPPLSRKWRSGSKPWLSQTSHQPHLYQTTAPPPSPTTNSTRPQPRHISPPAVVPPTPSPHTAPIVSSLSQLRRSPRLRPLAASASALITPPPVYYPAPSDLNLDRAG
jgi:hypothetical protein